MGKLTKYDYRYLKLADALLAVNQKVNLFGVVAEYTIPKRSKGTDWFCSLRIVDETHHSSGMLVNFFAATVEKLPQVQASGDIIQLCQVQMKTHNNETYALFNKRFSSFALYEGKYGQSLNPYQSYLKCPPRNQDMILVADLRKWIDGFQLDTVSKESVLFRQIKEGEGHDLVCKILHVSEVTKDNWVLYVWDGSDAPQLQINSRLEDEEASPLPLQLERQPLHRHTLRKFPTVGTILRVFVDQRNAKLNLPSLSADRWVRIINLTLEVHEGLWCGVLMPSTKVRFVPNEDPHVLERQRGSETRVSSKWDRMPFTSFPWPSSITELDSEIEEVPPCTLMDCITFPQVTAKFKCVIRVVAALPWKVEDFRSPSGTYHIRLTLEDPTARIHAYLYADDAEVFFEECGLVDELTRKWHMLLGVAKADNGNKTVEAPRNPPWVQCCLKSYYLDKSDPWGSRSYRIFGTRLVC